MDANVDPERGPDGKIFFGSLDQRILRKIWDAQPLPVELGSTRSGRVDFGRQFLNLAKNIWNFPLTLPSPQWAEGGGEENRRFEMKVELLVVGSLAVQGLMPWPQRYGE